MSYSNCAIIITVHNHVARFGFPCLMSVLKFSGDARIYLYDNQSTDPAIVDLKHFANKHSNVMYRRIDDQEEFGGLTGTWNDGISRAREEGLEKVILLNHDVVVRESWGSFIEAIDSDFCIYGPLSDNPGGALADKGIQYAKSATFCGLIQAKKLLGFCIGFTLGEPELKLFDDWRFFNPTLPFGGNEFDIQKRMEKRSDKTKFYVVSDCWVRHHLNMGWKERPRFPDPHDSAAKQFTQATEGNIPGLPRLNYLSSFGEPNLFHILLKEILNLAGADIAKLGASNLYLIEDGIDVSSASQIWRSFVLSNIFHKVEHVRKEEADYLVDPRYLQLGSSFQHYVFDDYPPKKEFIQLCQLIASNSGIDHPDESYVLLNQRPKGDRYLVETETGLALQDYLLMTLDERGIPFRNCDFSLLTPDEQASICSAASVFVSAHGAGISNTIFTPQHCHVMEYNFRKHWNCDPVCDAHFHGLLKDHEKCEAKLTFKPHFHKADYHNLCHLLGRPYTELEVVRYGGFYDRNPISRRILYVDGASLLTEIEKQWSSRLENRPNFYGQN